MRIITPTGKLCEVHQVIPFVETSYGINKERNNVISVSKNMSMLPSGIRLADCCYIGNIAPDRLQKILECLLMSGYYDFSKMEYQQVAFDVPVTIDNGVSLPYFNEYSLTEEDFYE